VAITKSGKQARRAKERAAVDYLKAQRCCSDAKQELEVALAGLGASKIEAMRGPVATFTRRAHGLKLGTEVMPGKPLIGSGRASSTSTEQNIGVTELEDVVGAYKSAGLGAIVGGGAGAGAYVAVPVVVANVATASTGAAISSLSGAAAANATLAWLGGGSLAAGGGGMAAGAVVLTGIAAAPVLLIGGGALWFQSRRLLKQRQADAAAYRRETSKLASLTAQLQRATDFVIKFHTTFAALVDGARAANRSFGQALRRQQRYSRMNVADREAVALAATYSWAICSLAQCPQLLTDKGKPTRRASAMLKDAERQLSNDRGDA
jgi:hypothetical protein